LGFLGIMGMGHLYMDKAIRGVVLFIIGGFLASLSLYSWIYSLGMTEYSIGIRVFTSLVMSAPYLLLQIWQSFDAPKPKKDGTKGKY
jgi:flavin-dependent dehydrogenase